MKLTETVQKLSKMFIIRPKGGGSRTIALPLNMPLHFNNISRFIFPAIHQVAALIWGSELDAWYHIDIDGAKQTECYNAYH